MVRRDDFEQNAEQTPFDPSGCEAITSDNTQGAVEDLCGYFGNLAKPPYSFGRVGTHGNDTWLKSADSFSNVRGLPFELINGKIIKVKISTDNVASAFSVEIWHHLGNLASATLIGTVTTDGTKSVYYFDVDWNVPQDVQLAVKVASVGATKPRETAVYLITQGDLT